MYLKVTNRLIVKQYSRFIRLIVEVCTHNDWIGDGYCDDATNTEICNFDGGDCCSENIVITFCKVCECIGENTSTEENFNDGESVVASILASSTYEYLQVYIQVRIC